MTKSQGYGFILLTGLFLLLENFSIENMLQLSLFMICLVIGMYLISS